MPNEIPILFINLTRRSDRSHALDAHLKSKGLFGTRIEACDARELDQKEENLTLCSLGEIACWVSHSQALASAANKSEEYSLILEDDAVLIDLPDWQTELSELVQGMKELEIDVLQIGFIEHLASYRRLERILSFVLARARRDFTYIGHGRNRRRVQLFEFLAGSHAYIVSRSAAEVMSKFNYPVARAADDFFGDLAIRGKNRSGLRFGRLTKSLVRQVSRGGEVGVQIDSDTSPQ